MLGNIDKLDLQNLEESDEVLNISLSPKTSHK
jgi:hypothetical protein